MEKKISFLILILVTISACNTKFVNSPPKNDANATRNSTQDLPDWILNPYTKNGIAAIGISNPTKQNQGYESRVKVAENDAKEEILKIIDARLSRITDDILEQIEFKNPVLVKNIIKNATKEVVRGVDLSKASKLNVYKDEDGVIYVRLFVKNADYRTKVPRIQKIYQKYVDDSELTDNDRKNANEAVLAFSGHSKHHYWFHKTDLY